MGTSYYNVWTNDPFIYKSTISGVNVYGLGGDSLSILGFIEYENTSGVWADDNYVYIATSVSGIYRCDVSTVTGTVTLTPYKQYPEITSNYVYYIHGGGDYLCATTVSGVDHYNLITGSGIYTTLSGVGKCFQTERGEFYYSYNKFEEDKELHVVYDNTNNWDVETVGNIYTINTYDADRIGWLGTWDKRIKLTIDNTNVDGALSGFPVLVKLSDSSGISSTDLTSVFTDLHPISTVTHISDACDGIFIETWVDKSNEDSYAGYSGGKLSLDINTGGAIEGVNALTAQSFLCLRTYTLEFDWYPADGADWYDDDVTDAQNLVEIVPTNPVYNTSTWNYNLCEYNGVGTKSKMELHLRSNKSNVITIKQRVNGGVSTLINTSFTYGSSHHVRWVINFDSNWTELYMDGNKIGSRANWDGSFLDYIGEEFKLNFHWHSYARTANQCYDNLYLIGGGTSYDNRKKIAVTASDGVTQRNVEIERWDVVNNEAWLWVGVPLINVGIPTVLYLYYDSTQSGNTTYIGDTGDTPAQSVWNDNFKLIMHMAQNPNGDVADIIRDSTSNADHGTPGGSMTPADLVDGKVGKAIDFDGVDDKIYSTITRPVNTFTIEYIIKASETHQIDSESTSGVAGVSGQKYICYPEQMGVEGGAGISVGTNGVSVYEHGNSYMPALAVYNGTVGTNQAFVVVVYNSKQPTIYLNGESVRVGLTSIKSLVYSPKCVNGGNYGYFNGNIDEVRTSNIARSDAWIKATYYSNWDNLVSFGTEESYEDLVSLFRINDLYVTEKTSRYNEGNVIFIATGNGVTVIEEKPGDEENNNYKYYYINT